MRYFKLFFIGFSLILFGCAKEQEISVKLDFDINYENDSHQVPAKIKIKNLSQGIYEYKWLFLGAVVEHSTDVNPIVIYKKSGNYEIKMTGIDSYGEEHVKTKKITIYDKLTALFSYDAIEDTASPLTLKMNNLSSGAMNYIWYFENGKPNYSTEKNPEVVFTKVGKHKIKLLSINHKDTLSFEKTVTVTEGLTPSFKWTPDFKDNYEAPVKIQIENTTTGAKKYEWFVKGAIPETSYEENPIFKFDKEGVYKVQLKVSNSKEEKLINKTINIKKSDNLLEFNNIKFGINTNKADGFFFSSRLAKVLKNHEITAENGSLIELVFFGLNVDFQQNRFVSPSEVEKYVFDKIPNASQTLIINSQEYLSNPVTTEFFETLSEGKQFDSIDIIPNNNTNESFTKELLPRLILFQTQDGRKGIVKIKKYISKGENSYILTDIKIQKYKTLK